MNVICLGINHSTAGVDLRERFAVPEGELGETVSRIASASAIDELVILSTCNRVECYAATAEPEAGFSELTRFFGERNSEPAGGAFYRYHSSHSIRHLFRVVCGLDSMIIGETEILGQVKRAYHAAAAEGKTARNLNKLFQRAFSVAKEVRTKTNITRGSVSVGSVAVSLAEKIFGRLPLCRAMVLGAGETSEQTARALLSRGVRELIVSNRSFDRAQVLASSMRGKAVPFSDWTKEIDGLDILISSTSAPQSVVTYEKLAPIMASRKNRPLFLIDLAVPRDIDPEVNRLEGVYLYDIDSLMAIAQSSLDVRRLELPVCEQLIERHVEDFSAWLSSHGSQPDGAAIDPVSAPAGFRVSGL